MSSIVISVLLFPIVIYTTLLVQGMRVRQLNINIAIETKEWKSDVMNRYCLMWMKFRN